MTDARIRSMSAPGAPGEKADAGFSRKGAQPRNLQRRDLCNLLARRCSAGRIAVLGALIAVGGSAAANERAAVPPRAPAAPVNVSVSYALNLPLSEGALLVDAANNRAYKRSLYQKAASECEDFIATIARSCAITNINVSTQENRYAGQPATLYVSISISMQITPK